MNAGAYSALIEGGFTFSMQIVNKIKSGKSIKDFSDEDWTDILKQSGISTIKGGIRDISIYVMTNYTVTPSAVANSLVTASFGIAQQGYMLKKRKITIDEFIRNSEVLCVDVSVSSLSSLIGQAVIPIPVVGAVLGNTIGHLIYQTIQETLEKQDRKILEEYINEINALVYKLNKEYEQYVYQLDILLEEYFSILDSAFAVDYAQAFEGSILLAEYTGVSKNEILKSDDEIDDYFLN